MNDTYRIHVRGHIEERWTDWLGGFSIHRLENGTTELIGPVVDQAALHGVIARIRDLGVPLLAVDRVEASRTGSSSGAQSGGDGRR